MGSTGPTADGTEERLRPYQWSSGRTDVLSVEGVMTATLDI